MKEVPGDAGYNPGKFSRGLPDERFDDLYVAKAISVVRQKELEAILSPQDICCRCGARTYKDFKKTGKAHVCKDLK